MKIIFSETIIDCNIIIHLKAVVCSPGMYSMLKPMALQPAVSVIFLFFFSVPLFSFFYIRYVSVSISRKHRLYWKKVITEAFSRGNLRLIATIAQFKNRTLKNKKIVPSSTPYLSCVFSFPFPKLIWKLLIQQTVTHSRDLNC